MRLFRPRQDQTAGADAIAIQSCRDTNIINGLSVNDVKEIIETIGDQLPRLALEATKKLEERLDKFETEILARFESDETTNINSFADPDFQFLLANAQRSYARSGSEQVIQNLVDLIAERSKVENQSRLALTINNAAERVAQLTRHEFSELSFAFLLRHVSFTLAKSPNDVAKILNIYAMPLADDVEEGINSYSYMESIGCGKLSISSTSLPAILLQTHPKVFLTGFSRVVLEQTTEIPVQQLIDAGLFRMEPSSDTVISEVDDLAELLSLAKNSGIEADQLRNVWHPNFLGVPMDEARVIDSMRDPIADQSSLSEWRKGFHTDIDALHHLWERSSIKHFELTPIGIAIGFSNLTNSTGFEGSLTTWIK